jgi:DNA-damage-inducible protein D
MNEQNKLTPFEGKEIRKVRHEDQWFFSVIDVIEVLTDSATPRKYWNTLKTREPQLSSVCGQLKLPASDGKKYKTDCANTEGVLRILMSVPLKLKTHKHFSISQRTMPQSVFELFIEKRNIAKATFKTNI